MKGAIIIASAILLAASVAQARPPSAPGAPVAGDATVLDRLAGTWEMTGTVHGTGVRYSLEVEPVLGGRFLKLHMRDRGEPSKYEAIVFLGRDEKTSHLSAHWLDVFGPGPAATLGTGELRGEAIVLDFPYPDGAFKTFADYRVSPGKPAPR
jgi:hypothetical protein